MPRPLRAYFGELVRFGHSAHRELVRKGMQTDAAERVADSIFGVS